MKYIFISIAFLTIALPTLNLDNLSALSSISFYLEIPIFLFMIKRALFNKNTGISFSTVTIFSILFFFVAPILQINKSPNQLVNLMPLDETYLVYANLLVIIFLSFYTFFYFGNTGKNRPPITITHESKIGIVFIALTGLSVIIAAWAANEINIRSLIDANSDESGTIGKLIENKILFQIPFVALSIYLARQRRKRNIAIIFILLIFVVLTKNPFFEKRNSLGPVYLTLVLLAFPYFIESTKRYFLFLFTTLIFAFPASSILTNHPPSDWESNINSNLIFNEILNHFTEVHYDAWANISASIDYVENNGFQSGRQLSGSLLFYIPRSAWEEKPYSSGQVLGEYLTKKFSLWFDNISCPLPAEGYLDFGIFGLIIFSIILALYSKRLDFFSKSDNSIEKISSIYFSLFLIFALRGSLLPAFAFGVGAYFAINLIPYFISRISKIKIFNVSVPN